MARTNKDEQIRVLELKLQAGTITPDELELFKQLNRKKTQQG